jgi:phosphoglycerate dehydrogenase-like enzyme
MPKLLMDLSDKRPAWSLPGWVAGELREALPDGWTLQVMRTEADGSGDGVTRIGPELLEAVRDAEIYLGYGAPASLLREAGRLKWVHSAATGVGSSLTPEMRASPVLFTNSKGIHGPPMGDTALAMILHFARGLDFGVKSKAEGRWDTGPFFREDHPLTEMAFSTVGVFGFGGIGRQVAARARALGARVLAFDRGPDAFSGAGRISLGAEVDEGGSGFEPLYGEDGFGRLLGESDFLVIAAPETAETRGKLDADALARMKPTAVLINLSRGSLVVEDALVDALKKGRLRGAGLDVFREEPLPNHHPLWTLPNVVLTPHVSAVTRGFWRRQTDLILENLRRYLAGETLLNLVDKEAGF